MVPTPDLLRAFLFYCYRQGVSLDQVKKIRSAASNYYRSDGLTEIPPSAWRHAIQAQDHRPLDPPAPSSRGCRCTLAPLLVTYWLIGARRAANKTLGPNSFIFEPVNRVRIVNLYKSKVIARPVDQLTFDFFYAHLLDVVDTRSVPLSPAMVLNTMNDSESITLVRREFVRAGLARTVTD
ncbi:hypothetical protein SARC_05400 [Sphaeroforma arctica JP610]|uniref:Uncharacterized protein n=1 Tax=Sphaeroforma arctica JP610 TaxID=667725 RepID=A0A0L0G286_9EUKA|nr:hypothetical protein SARC_05400 [Sphaeroforma arctica JP610]KNC82308.1 hypothetical protein SARC_05400 [Sphaeroforma arctica JP610]|eukprot:XP_014156210.1 hypothetical protein SARC_05400 [Sphaeroforma arctica JP610]